MVEDTDSVLDERKYKALDMLFDTEEFEVEIEKKKKKKKNFRKTIKLTNKKSGSFGKQGLQDVITIWGFHHERIKPQPS